MLRRLATQLSVTSSLSLLLCLAHAQPVAAGDMDPELTRLTRASGSAGCPAGAAAHLCPDDASFELLATELAGALAPMVSSGAATGGARSFYVGVSSSFSNIRGRSSYWAQGTRGSDPQAARNGDVDSLLSFHRIALRKGLPFGIELGSSVGFGLHTSLWVIAAEAKLALFEGFRSGLGALPDVALHGVVQTVVGSPQLSLQTQSLDIELSKPFVIRRAHIITPIVALQLLFLQAQTTDLDFTPQSPAWAACAPSGVAPSGASPLCQSEEGASDLLNNASFRAVSRTRVRMFVGAEERYDLLSIALSLGVDLIVPPGPEDSAQEALPPRLLRQFSLQLAGGLRY